MELPNSDTINVLIGKLHQGKGDRESRIEVASALRALVTRVSDLEAENARLRGGNLTKTTAECGPFPKALYGHHTDAAGAPYDLGSGPDA